MQLDEVAVRHEVVGADLLAVVHVGAPHACEPESLGDVLVHEPRDVWGALGARQSALPDADFEDGLGGFSSRRGNVAVTAPGLGGSGAALEVGSRIDLMLSVVGEGENRTEPFLINR